MAKQMNLSHYFRYLWEEPNLIIIIGNSNEIIKGHNAYLSNYNIIPPEESASEKLSALFAAAALAAVSLPERESWGWSFSLPGSLSGLFCGIEPEGMVCGRIIQTEKEKNIAAVQRQKPGSEMTQSNFTLKSTDPVKGVEQYFEESEQNLVRIAINKKGDGVLIHALPGGDFENINHLSDNELITICSQMAGEDKLKKLEEVLLFYECRCNDEMMLTMITGLPERQRKELWENREKLEIECPRCKRSFTIQRKQ